MNLLEILTTAEKIEKIAAQHSDELSAKVSSFNYMINACIRTLQAEKLDGSFFLGHDLLTPSQAIIKIAILSISSVDHKSIDEASYNKLLFDPLKNLTNILSNRFPEEKMNPSFLDTLKYKNEGITLGKERDPSNITDIQSVEIVVADSIQEYQDKVAKIKSDITHINLVKEFTSITGTLIFGH